MSIQRIAIPCIAALAVVSAAAVSAAAAPAAAAAAPAAAADAGITPFTVHYSADWKSINVGTSDIELKPDSQPGHYVYTWTITARGVFRLYRAGLTQKSWLSIDAGHVRPEKYHAEDGASTVSLDFDWNAHQASGTSEGKPVQFALSDGIQDVMSIQVEVMLDLKNGDLPKTFQIVDKDEVKEFIYSQEGTARINTAVGDLDTVIVSSQRSGNNRILRMWFAPSLGYIPVQAERTRDGKLELAMRIKSLTR
jgi:Protein of unknown function (DUF3108)